MNETPKIKNAMSESIEEKKEIIPVATPVNAVVEKKTGFAKIWEAFNGVTSSFSKTFLSPAIITVVITAVAGPFVVNKINSDMKNKEIQQEVINTVLDYTNKADFSKPESIEKITIIARMVDENRNVFGLSFRQTDSTIQSLYGQISKVGLANLDKKKQEYVQKITDISSKLKTDSALFVQIVTDLTLFETELDKYVERKNNQKITEFTAKIAEKELQKKDVENRIKVSHEQIAYWNEQLLFLEEDMKVAQENLADLLATKRERESEMEDVLNQARHNEDTLRVMLQNYITKIQSLEERLKMVNEKNLILEEKIKTFETQTVTEPNGQ